ncbi:MULTISPECIES: MCE family protein [Nocardia]|uniref:Mce family protein n=2 Tax=Nocardia TaxID=1817 RepID=K0EH07_NOCB7|nr:MULTISPECIES: MCE family protein [Nocardia]AFT98557.1 Mce family protein [Nocardia brasiliensis ATCC 700358]ASF10345.1 MCE family protein [Nocardia brasiliensis]KIA60577.1 mammalian cell entry protein [Nocardia vulneris]MBF6124849.1 MCE family protein [Nocardia brasiliensis]MBF6548377.1 MCE family protein [Nocardia brasiliensis]
MNEQRSRVVTIGIVGLVVAVCVALSALQFERLPFIRGGANYTAFFADAGGLLPGDPVQVAGVRTGRVDSVHLDGDKVLVRFTLDESIVLGQKTAAAIKTNTVLGRKSLELTPTGPGALRRDDTIPLDRTTSPYSLNDALGDLGRTVQGLDLEQVDKTLDTLSATFADTPAPLRAALDGVTALSRSINARDQALSDLLVRAQSVTKILADRSNQINMLLLDGNNLLGELDRRRGAIGQLIVYVNEVAKQLSGLVNDNEAQLKPALDKLNSVLGLLQRNKQNLSDALDNLGPYAAALGEQVGNGPWFNAYVVNATSTQLQGLVDALVWPEHLPDDLRNIFTHPAPPSIGPSIQEPPR